MTPPEITSSQIIHHSGWLRTCLCFITKKMAGVSTVEVATQVPFYDLCALLERIASTTGTEKKKKILEFFVNSWREAHAKLHGTSKTAEYICCIDGLLLNLKFLIAIQE